MGRTITSRTLPRFFNSRIVFTRLQEVVFGCKDLYTIEGKIDNIQMLFNKPVEDVWLNGYYISPKEEGPTHTFYRCGDVLVMERYGDFWLGSNSDLHAHLNGDILSSIKLRKIETV